MRYFLYIIFIFSSSSIFAQSDVTILYVDASENENRLNAIIQKANSIINQSNDNVLLYIANGENPMLSENRDEFKKTLNKIKRDYISSPNLLNDVRLINDRILANSWITNLNNNEELSNELSFVFMIEEGNYHSFQIEDKFIKQILFSNNLYQNDILKDNCTVKIILDKNLDSYVQDKSNEITFSYEYL